MHIIHITKRMPSGQPSFHSCTTVDALECCSSSWPDPTFFLAVAAALYTTSVAATAAAPELTPLPDLAPAAPAATAAAAPLGNSGWLAAEGRVGLEGGLATASAVGLLPPPRQPAARALHEPCPPLGIEVAGAACCACCACCVGCTCCGCCACCVGLSGVRVGVTERGVGCCT